MAGLVAIAALVLAACGGSSDSSSSESSGAESTPAESTESSEGGANPDEAAATEEGKEYAESLGAPVSLPAKTIGILQSTGSTESALRVQNEIEAAADELSWKSVPCDGEGLPTKFATCASSLLNQGVDAMITIGIEASAITPQLEKAQQMKVPAIQVSGTVVPSPLYGGSYFPDDAKAGTLLADFLAEEMEQVDGTADIAVHNFAAIWAQERTEQLDKKVKEDPSLKITSEVETDATNVVEGTRKTVTDQLTQNPDLKAFWFAWDFAGSAGAQAVQAKYPGKTFPERPLVVTFHADLGTNELIEQGAIDAVVNVPYNASSWVAIDQLAELWGRNTPLSKEPAPTYNGFEVYNYNIVNKENLPPAGEYPQPENDFFSFFKSKWETEFK
jgi:ribose transport system substrate-binding protein